MIIPVWNQPWPQTQSLTTVALVQKEWRKSGRNTQKKFNFSYQSDVASFISSVHLYFLSLLLLGLPFIPFLPWLSKRQSRGKNCWHKPFISVFVNFKPLLCSNIMANSYRIDSTNSPIRNFPFHLVFDSKVKVIRMRSGKGLTTKLCMSRTKSGIEYKIESIFHSRFDTTNVTGIW